MKMIIVLSKEYNNLRWNLVIDSGVTVSLENVEANVIFHIYPESHKNQ